MRNNYHGFTLIECLISLFFISLFFLMLSGVFSQSQQIFQRVESREELEWQIFLIQFDKITEKGTFRDMSSTALIFEREELHEGKVVTLAIKYSSNKNYVYLSNNGGTEPILTQVQSINFDRQGDAILFTVRFLNGVEKVGKWTIP
ncbi:competence type IV pilus minor pilin ComGF [Enterococcus sp.]|uniref:competence type IV pilus minor pilin ComGF n=1 Tax=Enterococcus sp. TaxID=35783 RepID=UPI002FC7A266